MVEGKATIENSMGIHTEVASHFVAFASKFSKCKIFLVKGNREANAKSLLNLIILGLNYGDEMTVRVQGEKEEEVLKAVLEYVKNIKDES